MRNRWWIMKLPLLLIATGLIAYVRWQSFLELPSEPPPQSTMVSPFVDLSPLQFRDLLQTEGTTLINVHVPYDGKISGTHLEVPFDQIDQELKRLPADRAAKVALYCISGRMSETAARKLGELGYTNVYNLSGGMLAWDRAGLPLEDWSR